MSSSSNSSLSSESSNSSSSVSSNSSSSSSSSELGMTGALATVTQYNNSIPTDPLATNAVIEQTLMVASGAIRDYLFRNLTLEEYSQWFTLDGLGQSELF